MLLNWSVMDHSEDVTPPEENLVRYLLVAKVERCCIVLACQRGIDDTSIAGKWITICVLLQKRDGRLSRYHYIDLKGNYY